MARGTSSSAGMLISTRKKVQLRPRLNAIGTPMTSSMNSGSSRQRATTSMLCALEIAAGAKPVEVLLVTPAQRGKVAHDLVDGEQRHQDCADRDRYLDPARRKAHRGRACVDREAHELEAPVD